jgi:hypothetical protein
MTLTTISIIIATVIFVAYNAVSLALFGIPKSLSMTYYLYKEKYNKGFLFPTMMYLVVAFMMPAWITMSEGSNFQFLSFLAPAGILFVGSAPAFLSSDLENMVHQVSAYLAAAFSLLWIVLVTPYWWIILVWVGIITAFAFFTKSVKTSYIYWLEMVAFGSTFTSTIMYSL